jgi:sugar lactone lactonase YvrE
MSAGSLTYGQPEVFTATVTTNPPSAVIPDGGAVKFMAGATVLDSETLAAGTATFSTTSLGAGTHVVSAVYSGNANFLGSSTPSGQAGTITTVASGGVGDGDPATSATLSYPLGVTLDAAGDIFIADWYHQRIRKIDGSTHLISTVAGYADIGFFGIQAGYSGDNGPATAAQLNNPSGVAVDALGKHLFIADRDNSRVREVDLTTNIITTVAGNGTYGYSGDGGPATAAELRNPEGVALDPSGQFLYIADQHDERIRRVDLTTHVITTIAGTGDIGYNGDNIAATSDELNNPSGVAVDAAGDVFIADSGNCRIRKVDAASHVISTVAGTGTPGYSGDNGSPTAAELGYPFGVAVNASGQVLFIGDTNNQRIRKVDLSANLITTVAGTGYLGYSGDGGPATSATLNYPRGVAVDGSLNVYLIDNGNHVVRKIDAATQIIHTVGGDGSNTYGGDGGPATAATIGDLQGVSVDASGNLFIADRYGDNRIREVNGVTQVITTIAGNGTGGYTGDGGLATAAEINYPQGVAVDPNGDVFIADVLNYVVREVLPNGVITTVAGGGTHNSPTFTGLATDAAILPRSVAVDGAGDLFICDDANVVREVKGGVISTIAGTGMGGFSGDGGPATAAELDGVTGIGVDPAGHFLYIADNSNVRVRQVNLQTGVISTIAGNGSYGYTGDGGPATAATLNHPYGVAIDAPRNLLYIGDSGNQVIRKVNLATGVITTAAGNGTAGYSGNGGPATAAQLAYPGYVAVDGAGNLFISDNENFVVREVTASGGQTVTVAKAPLTVTANSLSKTYGAAVPPLTYTITGFVNGDTSSVITGTPSVSATATVASGVGSYPISIAAGTLDAANYDFPGANLVGNTLTITPAPLSVIVDAKTRVYGQANPPLTGTVSGILNSDAVAVNYATTTTTASGVLAGGYSITVGSLSGPKAGDYSVTVPGATVSPAFLTITKAHLTVTADPQTKAFGAAVPALTYRISGFVNGDTSSVVAGAPNVTTTATAASSLGSYPISIAAGTLSASNYDFPAANFVGSTLTVTAPLVTMTNVSAVLTKRHWVMKILVTFDGSVNVTEAQDLGIYRLTMAGMHGSFTVKSAKVITLRSATYSNATHSVLLIPRKSFSLTKPVQLQIDGVPPSGLRDIFGRYIDGARKGQSGSNAVAVLR